MSYIEGRKPAFGPCGDIIGGTAGFALCLLGGYWAIALSLMLIDWLFGTKLGEWFLWLIGIVTLSR